ncbi:MAG: endonuclease/exonuclease/phosphatase family protein, partial [Verrucomicrobiae bacterium]|nr:endonuclease/exonuclease/phosphatase family protein [Verrucomicrobiae bacterium]
STGDAITEPIHGNITYSYGNYKIGVSKKLGGPRPATYPEDFSLKTIPGEALKISTFNVENLYPELPEVKFKQIARIIIDSLKTPDLIGLQEIHDNSGPKNDGTVDAKTTLQQLTDFIVREGGPRYRFLQLNPENNADGGWPGANIRNAFLYLPTMTLGASYRFQDPAFDENDASEFSGTRKPLIAFFKHGEKKLIVINCHLRSKGGDSPTMGTLFPPVRFSEVQRTAQTRALRKHVEELRQKHPDAGIVVLGDMNDFEFSPALENLTQNGGLINLVESVPLNQRYTYIFQGFSQVLDHILVSDNLSPAFSATIVHVNADRSSELRASDHDPVLAWLK